MYVVGYPRSGNTWLCYLLAYSLNAEYEDVDDPGVHPRREILRRSVKGGLSHTSYQNHVGRVLKTHALELSPATVEPVVYLARDGRDVMVSYYFYARASGKLPIPLRGGRSVIQRAIRRAWFQLSAGRSTGSSFTTFLRVFAPDWAVHARAWLARNLQGVVRYEDLHNDPGGTLAIVCGGLGLPVSPDVIDEAVGLFSFERMSGRQQGEENSQAFFRKGSTRDWQNHFSDSDLVFFYAKAGDVLHRLGYPSA